MNWSQILLLCLAGRSFTSAKCWNNSANYSIIELNLHIPRRYGEMRPELILKGPLHQIGEFLECVDTFNEQYCLTEVRLQPGNQSSVLWHRIQEQNSIHTNYRRDLLYVGLCTPAECNGEDISENFKYYLSPAAQNLGVNVNVSVKNEHCTTGKEKPLLTADYVAGSLVMAIMALVLSGTTYDSFRRLRNLKRYPKTTCGKIFMCFSVIANWERLGTLSETEESTAFRCIQGIRSISMYLVVAGHVLFVSINRPLKNPEFIEKSYHDFFRSSLCNGQATMSTFFCISGFLLSYFFLKEADARGSIKLFHIIKAILHRYMRLTPVYAVVLLLQASWMDRMGTGPIWSTIVSEESKNCRLYWWTNLLYLNNYVHHLTPCMIHTWYLAADFQCYVLSMLLLVPVWKYPKYARQLLAGVLVIWIIIPFVQTYMQRLEPVILNTPENVKNFPADRTFNSRYITFHGNAGAYTVGVIFGYFYYYVKRKVFKRTMKMYILIWAINLTVPWTILVLPFMFYMPSYTYNVLTASIFASISKVIYAAGIGTIVTSFALGYGGIGNTIASWKPFQIFGRLSYTVYLIHPCLLRVEAGAMKEPVYLNEYNIFQAWFATVVISSTVALLFCLMVELPSSALAKLMSKTDSQLEDIKPLKKSHQKLQAVDGATKETLLEDEV